MRDRATRLLACVALAVLLAGCVHSATGRLMGYFDLVEPATVPNIERQLAERFPIGTPRAEVVATLRERGLGTDEGTWILDEPDRAHVLGEIRPYPLPLTLVEYSWLVRFHLDDDGWLLFVSAEPQARGL